MKSSASITQSALGGRRVLDLADEKGVYCTKLLADMGADVIRIEPPGGDPMRRFGPFVNDIPHPERSLFFYHYNTSKRGITLNLETSDGQEIFRKLAKTTDIIVETYPVGYLDNLGLGYSSLSKTNPGLILVSVTPFGQTGPYKDYKGSDIVGLAMGGLMYTCGPPDRPPLMTACYEAYHTTSQYAAIGALAALYNRNITGRGQHVDVSMQECVASILFFTNELYIYKGIVAKRSFAPLPSNPFNYNFRCKDGYVSLHPSGRFDVWTQWMDSEGMASALKEPEFSTQQGRLKLGDQMNDIFERWTMTHTKAELVEGGQARRLAAAPLNSVSDLLTDPQLVDRGFFVDVKHPELGKTIKYPGAPYRFSETPWKISRRAPLIGEHNLDIYEGELGYSKKELSTLASAGVIGVTKNGAFNKQGQSKPVIVVDQITESTRPPLSTGRKMALDGLRVIDFSWVLAGPTTTKILAEHGAEVIKVERPEIGEVGRSAILRATDPVGVNLSPHFNNINRGKYSVTLNLKDPRGIEIVKKLISLSDVVVENYTAGVMDRLGLGYEILKQVKPDIIMVSMSGMGQTGPYRDFLSYANTVEALSGLYELTGYPDRGPGASTNAYGDYVAGLASAISILEALDHRQKTGKGQYVDLSQLQATCAELDTAILDYTVNGRSRTCMGNRLPHIPAAPHGAYPCKGDDRWCAISVFTEKEWRAFCGVIGNPAWTASAKFASVLSRIDKADELDALVAFWTSEHKAEEVMAIMQAAGVPAGVLQTAEDLIVHDSHLKERGFFERATHAELGDKLFEGVPVKLSETPGKVLRASPLLGEHNDYVYRKLLGVSEGQINQWYIDGIV